MYEYEFIMVRISYLIGLRVQAPLGVVLRNVLRNAMIRGAPVREFLKKRMSQTLSFLQHLVTLAAPVLILSAIIFSIEDLVREFAFSI